MPDDFKKMANGDTVCIIGGGPGGSACAIALNQEAAQLGLNLDIVLIEQKKFTEHRQYNQCIGVLSPPLESILKEEFGINLPFDLIVREIKKYRLHSDHFSLDLEGEEHGKSWAVHRASFDAYMLEQAKNAGTRIIHNRVTGIEIFDDEVMIFTDGDNYRAKVAVAAFGLDDGSCRIFEQSTPYKAPDFLNTVITKLEPGEEFMKKMDSTIQAFLLSFPGLEFGAITPKKDHISINIAGRKVSSDVMLQFLRSEPVQRFLPPHKRREKPLNYFRGKFPIAPAMNYYGDRYVSIGDAAGLIRPFKGKGINSAILTGMFAARCIARQGVSKSAFETFYKWDCKVFTDDLPYGKGLRFLANAGNRFKFMDQVLKIASEDKIFMACMFNCVTAHKTYKEIIRETLSIPLGYKFLVAVCRHLLSIKD